MCEAIANNSGKKEEIQEELVAACLTEALRSNGTPMQCDGLFGFSCIGGRSILK
jgi:hypothetical protein